jgi:N-glycosyltransferase
MRVLLTSMPVYSHLAPMVVPVARALRAAGHEVLVASGPAVADELARRELPYRPLPRMLVGHQFRAEPELARAIGLTPDGVPLPELAEMPPGAGFGRLFAGVGAVRGAEDLRAVADEFAPDLIVREGTEFAGFLVADQIGVPCVTLDSAPMAPTRHPGLLPTLNVSRETLGLPPLGDIGGLTRDPWIGWLPARWWPDPSPAHRHYRSPAAAAEALDPEIAALPADRPLVLATLGSNAGHMLAGQESPLARIVTVLGELPCTGVVALGADVKPADWAGPRPDNVHLVSFAQQRLLLPACDVFLTHAGFGGVRESLEAGVPMVALPLYAEQPVNADRIAELGVGVRASDDIAAACRQVLDDPSFRHRAHGFQRQILALPGIDDLITDLEDLARRRR